MANGTGNLFAPRVIGIDSSIALGNKRSVSSMFRFEDIEGNSLKSISIIDNTLDAKSGYWEFNGTKLEAGRWHTFAVGQLKNLRFVGGLVQGADLLQIRAADWDGKTSRWSTADSFKVTTVNRNLDKPTVNVKRVDTLADEQVRLNGIITGRDADGFNIAKYRVRLTGPGYFTLGGKKLQNGTWITVNASAMGGLVYVAPSFGSGTLRATIQAQSFDGRRWSDVGTNSVVVKANQWRPDVTAVVTKLGRSDTVTLDAMVNTADRDGNSIKQIAIYDTGIAADGGYFSVGGTRLAARTWHTFNFENVARIVYNAATTFDQEKFRVKIFDGRFWSEIATADVSTILKPVIEVNGANGTSIIVLNEFDEIAGSALFNQTDVGPNLTQYEVMDLNGASGSGYFVANGQRLAAGRSHVLTAAEFATLRYVGGSGDNRYIDDFMIRAYNGTYWSDWKGGSVHTEPQMIESIDQFNNWTPTRGTGIEVTFSFMGQVPLYYADDAQERTNFISMNGGLRDAVRRALQMYTDISGITFREVSDTQGGVMRFGTADLGDDNILGWAYPPDGVLSGFRLPGDVWINNTSLYAGTPDDPIFNQDDGSAGLLTIIHEIGHAIGLSHPFDQFVRLPSTTDNRTFTVMSYAAPPSGIEPSSPQLYDIAAVQAKYGANMDFNSGNTIYRWTANSPTIETIWDGGGIDRFDFSNQALNVVADLRPGMFTRFANTNNAITIAYGALIENLTGGDGDDGLTGNYANNTIIGGKGADRIRGLGGNDTMIGGAGDDTYTIGIADGRDTINEQLGSGRDTLRLDLDGLKFANLTEAIFANAIAARRVGTDLHVAIWPSKGDNLASVVIKEMGVGRNRIETIEMYDGTRKIGRSVDLNSIYVQASDAWTRYKITEFSSDFGQIVAKA